MDGFLVLGGIGCGCGEERIDTGFFGGAVVVESFTPRGKSVARRRGHVATTIMTTVLTFFVMKWSVSASRVISSMEGGRRMAVSIWTCLRFAMTDFAEGVTLAGLVTVVVWLDIASNRLTLQLLAIVLNRVNM